MCADNGLETGTSAADMIPVPEHPLGVSEQKLGINQQGIELGPKPLSVSRLPDYVTKLIILSSSH